MTRDEKLAMRSMTPRADKRPSELHPKLTHRGGERVTPPRLRLLGGHRRAKRRPPGLGSTIRPATSVGPTVIRSADEATPSMPVTTDAFMGRRPPVTGKASKASTGNAVVKAKYMSPGRTAGYATYMTKDREEEGRGSAAGHISEYMQSHGGEGQTRRAELFTKAGAAVDLQSFIDASHHDDRVWTIILSPEQGHQLDIPSYTRAFMDQVETDVGRPLDYLAAAHYNTDNPHAHILLRGRDATGQDFRLDPAYVSHGLRARAIEVQARILGLARSQPLSRDEGLER